MSAMRGSTSAGSSSSFRLIQQEISLLSMIVNHSDGSGERTFENSKWPINRSHENSDLCGRTDD